MTTIARGEHELTDKLRHLSDGAAVAVQHLAEEAAGVAQQVGRVRRGRRRPFWRGPVGWLRGPVGWLVVAAVVAAFVARRVARSAERPADVPTPIDAPAVDDAAVAADAGGAMA